MVGFLPAILGPIFAVNAAYKHVQLIELFVSNMRRRERGRLAFETEPCFGEFECGDVEARLVLLAGFASHVRTGPKADLHQALNLEGNDCLSHSRATYVVFDSQFALGRQSFTNLVRTRIDRSHHLARELLIQTLSTGTAQSARPAVRGEFL